MDFAAARLFDVLGSHERAREAPVAHRTPLQLGIAADGSEWVEMCGRSSAGEDHHPLPRLQVIACVPEQATLAVAFLCCPGLSRALSLEAHDHFASCVVLIAVCKLDSRR